MATVSTEQRVKNNFSKVYAGKEWRLFKKVAEYYFRKAAFLKKSEILVSAEYQLLLRNSQKRLFIGVGTELLLKAYFLRAGFRINRPTEGSRGIPLLIDQTTPEQFSSDDTLSLNVIHQQLHRPGHLPSLKKIRDGFCIAKVFRNKEGHVVTSQHSFDPSNYRDIEAALVSLYVEGFSERLSVRFSVAPGEKAVWKVEQS
jgi:hypothetical protein